MTPLLSHLLTQISTSGFIQVLDNVLDRVLE